MIPLSCTKGSIWNGVQSSKQQQKCSLQAVRNGAATLPPYGAGVLMCILRKFEYHVYQ